MAIIVDHEPEYKGERKVRDAITEFFRSRQSHIVFNTLQNSKGIIVPVHWL